VTTAKPTLTTWIMAAVLIWGCLLALGSYLYGGNTAGARGAIVLGTTAGFLTLWIAALTVRKRRVEREEEVQE
jgi:hypothetical protein